MANVGLVEACRSYWSTVSLGTRFADVIEQLIKTMVRQGVLSQPMRVRGGRGLFRSKGIRMLGGRDW